MSALGDMCSAKGHVRFTPESGHRNALPGMTNYAASVLRMPSAFSASSASDCLIV